jgi:ubiquinone/menaquinone biosynthesis C-methylase UbiE
MPGSSFMGFLTTNTGSFPRPANSPLFPSPHYVPERKIFPELMDSFTGPEKRQILGDLERINRWFGSRRSIQLALGHLVTEAEPFSVLDIGAASGDSGCYIRSLYPQATVVSLDYQSEHLYSNTDTKIVADAFQLPLKAKSFDIVFSSLFLHHFDEASIVVLLEQFSKIAVRGIVAVDLLRHRFAYHFLPLTSALFRWHRISVHDGIRSVQAAFTKPELLYLAQRAGLKDPAVNTVLPFFRLALSAHCR